MKILCVSSYFLPYISGSIEYPARILSHFAQQGHSVQVLTFRYDPDLPEFDQIDGIKIRRLPYEIKIYKGFLSFSYPFRIFRDLKQCDVIIFNQPVFEGVLVIAMAKLLGKRVISLVNCEVDLGNGLINRVMNGCLNAAVLVQLLFSEIIVGYTQDYAEHNRFLRLFRSKLRFILPPVPKKTPSRMKQQELTLLKQENTWICYCGRVSKEKGLEYFIQSYRFLQCKEKIIYVFAGPYGKDVAGEAAYYRKIKSELELNNVPHLFLGAIDNDELGAVYQQIDCLVLPSINKTEAFGIVQVEAMSYGKPVIASNLPGVRIPVRMTGMGYLCEPFDAKDLAQKIDSVLSNPGFITAEKRQSATALFDAQRSFDSWDACIRSD